MFFTALGVKPTYAACGDDGADGVAGGSASTNGVDGCDGADGGDGTDGADHTDSLNTAVGVDFLVSGNDGKRG
jgi:hypothetical protein